MRGSTLVLAVCHVAELVCAMILALSFGLCIAAAPSNVALCSATMSPARRGSRFENNTRPTRMHTRIVRVNTCTRACVYEGSARSTDESIERRMAQR